ncbi:hypothetical protein Patl1_21680 [Pistacia atlantica]|uniref:Uncharacterized protein n=1 Tax=Pistacia atlantica TaxID=434234 RepID=A0ACC1BLG3_9ROSI|nr:hypothetical protein Patl1_21680 [Pistacia atlantica]
MQISLQLVFGPRGATAPTPAPSSIVMIPCKIAPIAEDENVVFLFELEIYLSFQVEVSFTPMHPAVNCGRGRSYTSCLPDP